MGSATFQFRRRGEGITSVTEMSDHDNDDGYYFGHRVYLSGPNRVDLRYSDTDDLVPRGPSRRPCPMCGELPTPEGHDPCIANLPGVSYACCGHGVEEGYVKFATGQVMVGRFDHARRQEQ